MKKIFLAILSVVLLFTGCENVDFGDTNKNVNGPMEPNTATLLSGAITEFSTRTGRPYRITPTLNVQWLMQVVYNDEMLYANYPGYWARYYVQCLSNLETVIEICSAEGADMDPAVTVGGSVENQIAVAKIFKSVVFKRVTDLFGDVPYSQAFKHEETFTPAYDKQEDIYAALIADVKEARDMIDPSADWPTGDPIYDGDMNKWHKFANSFLMHLALQVSEANSSKIDAEAVFAEAAADGPIMSRADEAIYTFDPDNAYDNPWAWMRPADYGVTSELIHSMKGEGDYKVTSNTTFDSRLQFMVRNYDTDQDGLPYGYKQYDSNQTRVNYILINAETRLPLFTAAYSLLHLAEGAARGWTADDPAAMLKEGIVASHETMFALYHPKQSYPFFIATPADSVLAAQYDSAANAYADARVADMATAPGGALQVIAEEKWIALFPLGYDGWAEWRRTGIPELTPAADHINDGNIPTRYNYPADEASLNKANYEVGVASLEPAKDVNSAKVWWDQ